MTKREEFKLEFYRVNDPIDGEVDYICRSDIEDNPYGGLNFLSFLDESEVDGFISEISRIQDNLPFDPDFVYTDGTEAIMIQFNNPYFLIDNFLEIHMDDLKELLQEWKNFRRQNPIKLSDRIIMLLFKLRQIIKPSSQSVQ